MGSAIPSTPAVRGPVLKAVILENDGEFRRQDDRAVSANCCYSPSSKADVLDVRFQRISGHLPGARCGSCSGVSPPKIADVRAGALGNGICNSR